MTLILKKKFKISKEKYERFIEISGDKNPMHVDSDYAISYGFREKIVHGNILNVFLSFVIGELLSKKNIIIIDQSIKYKKPLYVGMKIEIHLFLVDTIEALNVSIYNFKFIEKKTIATGKISTKEL